MSYIIIDTANMFYRSMHGVRGDADLKIGMAFLVSFNAIKKAWNDFEGHHCVIALEGKSWRKDFYKPYKQNRDVKKAALTPSEREEQSLFWEAFEEFKTFVVEKTNCTVLQHDNLEADDLIAGWIQEHPQSKHVIVSSDSDFHQLINENVSQYNGIADQHITHDGFFDAKGGLVYDKKTKLPLAAIDPEWVLFEKCMRGDTSDNVFSAYPGVRTTGTKKKVGLTDAFEDRNSKGFAWHNLLLQRWTDHNGLEHKVLDDYNRNKILIDLTMQPDNIRAIIKETIMLNCKPKEITQVGARMLKFCQSHDMKRMVDNIQQYTAPFQASYGA